MKKRFTLFLITMLIFASAIIDNLIDSYTTNLIYNSLLFLYINFVIYYEFKLVKHTFFNDVDVYEDILIYSLFALYVCSSILIIGHILNFFEICNLLPIDLTEQFFGFTSKLFLILFLAYFIRKRVFNK